MEKTSHRLFIFVLLFSPLALGAVRPWPMLIMESGVLLALLLLLISRAVSRDPLVRAPGMLPLMLCLGFVALQIVPLPAALVKLFSPATYDLYQNTLGIIGPVRWIPLSFDRHETLLDLARYTAYVGAYFLSLQLFADHRRLTSAVNVIVGFAAVLAVLSIVERYMGWGRTFWIFNAKVTGFGPSVNWDRYEGFMWLYNGRNSGIGPYVNRNHYAGFMGMVLPLVVALFFHFRPALQYLTFRERIVEFFSHPRSQPYILLGFSAVAVSASIFISLSRGSIVSTCITLGGLGMLLAARSAAARKGAISFVLLWITILLSVGWFGWEPIFERFDRIRSEDGTIAETRLLIWKDSLDIVHDFPVAGTGFGAFERIFPSYRTFPGKSTFGRVHNDYIELLTDGGAIGFILIGWFMTAVVKSAVSRFRKRRDSYAIHLFWGGLAGIFYMLLHSLTDFNLHIPANGLFFIVLVSIMVSAAHTRFRTRAKRTYLPALGSRANTIAITLTGAALLLTATVGIANVIANHYFYEANVELSKNETTVPEAESAIVILQKASLFAPFHFLYPQIAGDLFLKKVGNHSQARQLFTRSFHLLPVSSYTMRRLAICYARDGESETAEALFKAAVTYAPLSSVARKDYALWLVDNDRISEGISLLREAIDRAPDRTVEYMTALSERGVEELLLSSALPDRARPQLAYARRLEKEGFTDRAEVFFEKALDFLEKEETPEVRHFREIYTYYTKSERYRDALQVIRTAVSFFPDDSSLRLAAARCYEKCDIPYRAIEEYRKVLVLDPNNRAAKKRLVVLEGAE